MLLLTVFEGVVKTAVSIYLDLLKDKREGTIFISISVKKRLSVIRHAPL
jgi:hypothetical protein